MRSRHCCAAASNGRVRAADLPRDALRTARLRPISSRWTSLPRRASMTTRRARPSHWLGRSSSSRGAGALRHHADAQVAEALLDHAIAAARTRSARRSTVRPSTSRRRRAAAERPRRSRQSRHQHAESTSDSDLRAPRQPIAAAAPARAPPPPACGGRLRRAPSRPAAALRPPTRGRRVAPPRRPACSSATPIAGITTPRAASRHGDVVVQDRHESCLQK